MSVDLADVWPPMRAALEAMLADPAAQGMGLYVVSAYRSPDYQAQLFAAAVRTYGSERAAAKWVAPAWHSNHGPVLDANGDRVRPGRGQGGRWGAAVDLGAPNVEATAGRWPTAFKAQVDALAARYGLRQSMPWEDWHFEPIDPHHFPTIPAADPEEAELMAAKDDIIAHVDARFDQLSQLLNARADGTDANVTGRIQQIEQHLVDEVRRDTKPPG